MKPLTVVTSYSSGPLFEKTLLSLTKSAPVERVVITSPETVRFKMDRCRVLIAGPLPSRETLGLILGGIRTKYLILLPGRQRISIEPKGLRESWRWLSPRKRA